MALGRTLQFSFTAGEFSPRLLGRHDLQQYQDALKTMKNFVPLVHGGAKARVGTRFVDEVRDSADEVRLMPFVFSEDIARLIVLNNGFIQFVSDGAYLLDGAPRVELAHPYAEAELAELTFTQNGNTLYIFHDSHVPKQLQRTSDTVWTLTDVLFNWNAVTDFFYTSAYLDFKIIRSTTAFDLGDVFTITTDGAGGVTGTTIPGGAKGTIEQITIDPTLDAGGPFVYTITALTNEDTTQIQDWGVIRDDAVIPIAQFSPTSQPVTGAFFEQRLWLGGPPLAPQTLWGSRIGDFTDLTLGPKNDDGVEFEIASNTLNQIKHLVSARSLIALTTGEEFTISGTQDSGITATGVRIRTNTAHGISDTDPIKIGGEVIFAQKGGRRIRAISYEALTDSNTAPDISILAEHITGSDGIVEMAFAEEPDFVAWIIANDGRLLSLTLLRQQEVVAFAQHDSPGATGLFEHVAVIPEGTIDQTYFEICRIVDGSPVRYIEFLDYETTITASILGLTMDSATEGAPASVLDLWDNIVAPFPPASAAGGGFVDASQLNTWTVSHNFSGSILDSGTLSTTLRDALNTGGVGGGTLSFGADNVRFFGGSGILGASPTGLTAGSTYELLVDHVPDNNDNEFSRVSTRYFYELDGTAASTVDSMIAELNTRTPNILWRLVGGSTIEAFPGSNIDTKSQNSLRGFHFHASTGLPNDSTSYNFQVEVGVGTSNSTLHDVVVVGEEIQTFGELQAKLNAATTTPAGLSASVHWGWRWNIAGRERVFVAQGGSTVNTVDILEGTRTFQGFDHLIGASVDIVADGAAHPQRTVSDTGVISLQLPGSNVIAGLPFTPELELLHPEPFQGDSTRVQQFRPRNINILVQDTIGTDVVFQDEDGNEERVQTIPARKFGDLMDTPVPPLTDTLTLAGDGWVTPFNLIIRQNIPMPITILSVILEFQVDDT